MEDGKIELIEQFKVLFLHRSNKVVCLYNVSSEGITGTVADPRLILATALKVNAVSLILAHNHPSGSIKPSRADEELTSKIKHAASYFDIKVLDHIILSKESYYSFADEGLLWPFFITPKDLFILTCIAKKTHTLQNQKGYPSVFAANSPEVSKLKSLINAV